LFFFLLLLHFELKSTNKQVFEHFENASIKELRTLHGTSPSQLLSRSSIFVMSSEHADPSPSGPHRLVVASGDETTCRTKLWDAKEGALIQQLPAHSSPILDIRHFGDSSMDFLATLSEKQLFVHKLVK
jgi:hypothetical protein